MAQMDLTVWNEMLTRAHTPAGLSAMKEAQAEFDRHLEEVAARLEQELFQSLTNSASPPCTGCGGSGVERVYAGHGNVEEAPCSTCAQTTRGVRSGRCAWCGTGWDRNPPPLAMDVRSAAKGTVYRLSAHVGDCASQVRGRSFEYMSARSAYLDRVGTTMAKKATPPKLKGRSYDVAIIDEAKCWLPEVAPPPAQVLCACGCKTMVTPSPRWGAYADSAHMMRAARMAEREAFTGGPPLKLLSQADPKASRELELIDTIAATKTAYDNEIGLLRDKLAAEQRKVRELSVAPPPDHQAWKVLVEDARNLRAENERLLKRQPIAPLPMPGPTFKHLRETETAQAALGKTAVASAPAFIPPGRVRALPSMPGGKWSAPRPVTVACQSDEDYPFAYVED